MTIAQAVAHQIPVMEIVLRAVCPAVNQSLAMMADLRVVRHPAARQIHQTPATQSIDLSGAPQ